MAGIAFDGVIIVGDGVVYCGVAIIGCEAAAFVDAAAGIVYPRRAVGRLAVASGNRTSISIPKASSFGTIQFLGAFPC